MAVLAANRSVHAAPPTVDAEVVTTSEVIVANDRFRPVPVKRDCSIIPATSGDDLLLHVNRPGEGVIFTVPDGHSPIVEDASATANDAVSTTRLVADPS